MSSDASSLSKVEHKVEGWPGGQFAIRLYQQFQRDDVTDLAAQVAYNLIFALPPLLLFLVALAAFADRATGIQVTQDLHRLIEQHAPGDAKPLLDRLVTDAIGQASGAASSIRGIVAILLALWGAAGGVGALIGAFNRAYEVQEGRSFLRQKLTTLWLTLLTSGLVIAAFVLFVFGQRIGQWIANRAGLGHAFAVAWNILRWPVAIGFILVVLGVLYYFGPNLAQTMRRVLPGTVAATVLWVIAVLGFKLYLALANPGSAYGAAGSVIVLLVFLYFTALIFILGAEVNAVLEHRDVSAAQPAAAPSTATARSPNGPSGRARPKAKS